jgi:hypothetical protein
VTDALPDDPVTDESLNAFMRDNREEGPRDSFRCVAAIECRDGFTISVQGHRGAYSQPRENDSSWYSQVECGFPSAPVPQLLQWKDWQGEKVSDESDTQTVYGYAPVEVVVALLNAHGGIKGPKP